MYRRYLLKDLLYLLKTRILNTDSDQSMVRKRHVLLFAFLSLIIWGMSYFETNIKPTVIDIAEAKAQSIAVYAINDAINEEIVKKVSYSDLVSLHQDNQSKITALQVNVAKVNQMQALVSEVVQHKLDNLDSSELSIPLGNLMHSSVLAGWGPKIKIRIFPIGTVQSKFNGEFTTAGINQTIHKINLDIKEQISIIVPFISATKEVDTMVPIAETVILGNVPQTYLDVSGASDEERQKAQLIAPNLATKVDIGSGK